MFWKVVFMINLLSIDNSSSFLVYDSELRQDEESKATLHQTNTITCDELFIHGNNGSNIQACLHLYEQFGDYKTSSTYISVISYTLTQLQLVSTQFSEQLCPPTKFPIACRTRYVDAT